MEPRISTGWCPPVISWFITLMNYRHIYLINHSSFSPQPYLVTERYLKGGPILYHKPASEIGVAPSRPQPALRTLSRLRRLVFELFLEPFFWAFSNWMFGKPQIGVLRMVQRWKLEIAFHQNDECELWTGKNMDFRKPTMDLTSKWGFQYPLKNI